MPDDHVVTHPVADEFPLPQLDDHYVPVQSAAVAPVVAPLDDAATRISPVTTPRPPELPGDVQQLLLRQYAESRLADPERLTNSNYATAKRMLDLAVAIPALIALAPLFLVLAALIRMDSPGPAFFVQERIGRGGRIFWMIKFRSMADGCTFIGGRIHKIERDVRVTRIGGFLRKTSLDELPQLINVLKGEMSLVGPRPELPIVALRRYELWQYRRLDVPQGMTGWWQVTGRGTKLLCENTEDDIYYVQNASFWLDVKILLLTVRAVASQAGAF